MPKVGERIRQTRLAQSRSLADVAARADISVATLSRIENDKQAVDLDMFLSLARVLGVTPNDLLGGPEGDGHGSDPLARRIANLHPRDRMELWRALAAERRNRRARLRGDAQEVAAVDELLAHMDFLREELESVRRHLRRR